MISLFSLPPALVDALNSNIAKSLGFLAAVGSLSMAFVQVLKDIGPFRQWFNRGFLGTWFQQRLRGQPRRGRVLGWVRRRSQDAALENAVDNALRELGAVRVDQVAAGALGPITGEAMRWRVLFSSADKVLHYAFPIGQTAAKDGVFPTAVGRAGQPLAKWDSVDSPGYDHGYYWFGGKPDRKQPQSDDETTPIAAPLCEMAPLEQGDDVSPSSVAAFLGFATPNRIPAAAGPQENQIATHAVASSAIGAHQLGS